jgi:hypothetical protein
MYVEAILMQRKLRTGFFCFGSHYTMILLFYMPFCLSPRYPGGERVVYVQAKWTLSWRANHKNVIFDDNKFCKNLFTLLFLFYN